MCFAQILIISRAFSRIWTKRKRNYSQNFTSLPFDYTYLLVILLKGSRLVFFITSDIKTILSVYSLTSPYGHLYNTDKMFGPRNAKSHTFPTSIIRTLGSVPLLFVLERFDCIAKTIGTPNKSVNPI